MSSVPVVLMAAGPTRMLVRGSEALPQWREQNRLSVPGRDFIPSVKSGYWDGTWLPGKWCLPKGDGVYELEMSRGLVPRLLADLDLATDWDPSAPLRLAAAEQFLAEHPRASALRDYQREAFLICARDGWGRLALATNAGKGAVLALLAAFAVRQGGTVLVCCDELAVFDALRGEFEAWAGLVPAEVGAGETEPPEGPVVMAMVPTLAKRLKRKKDATAADRRAVARWTDWVAARTMLLLDEADKATATTWQRIIAAATGSLWRLGCSGSFPADRSYEDWQLENLMGPVLLRIANRDLVEQNVSATPDIELYSFDITPDLTATWPPEWWALPGPTLRRLVYERGVVYAEARHRFIAGLVRPGVPTAVVVTRIDHGKALAAIIPGAVFLDGSASETQRVAVLERFRQGQVPVVVVTRILDRGTNRLGHAADLIFASGEGSSRQVLQRIGRGLRRAEGKEFLRLVDVFDRVEPSQLPKGRGKRAARYLAAAAEKRLELYRAEGFAVAIIRHTDD